MDNEAKFTEALPIAVLKKCLGKLKKLQSEESLSHYKMEVADEVLPTLSLEGLALIAKKKPELVTPFILHAEDHQLAAMLPFIPFNAVQKEVLSLPPIKCAILVKRASLPFKKELLSQLDLTPLAYKQDKPTALAISIGDNGMKRLIEAFKSGDTDQEFIDSLEAKKKSADLLKPAPVEIKTEPVSFPKDFEDPVTGEMMEHPVIWTASGRTDKTTITGLEHKTEDEKVYVKNPFLKDDWVLPETLKEDEALRSQIELYKATQS